MKQNFKVLKPIRPNIGLEARYRALLYELIEEMNGSILYWLSAAYKANEPVLAQDALPAVELQRAIRKLARRWHRNWYKAAPKLAKYFALAAHKRSEATLRRILKEAGITVEFKMTAAVRDVLRANVIQNVSLIRSIPQQYFTQIEGMVMRSVTAGRDLGQLSKELQQNFTVTKRRAALIARHQNNMATATITRVRQEELELKARWRHSHAGKEPRPTHVAMHGKLYEPSKGMYDPDPRVKRNIWPGELVNCFPKEVKVSSFLPIRKLWRSFFNGPMVYIRVGADLLPGTFNHPILTTKGWTAINEVECRDEVICMVPHNADVIYNNKDKDVTFGDLFEAASIVFGYMRRNGICFNFYGDRPSDDYVDEIFVDQDLLSKLYIVITQHGFKFPLSKSYCGVDFIRHSCIDEIVSSLSPCFFNKLFSLFGSKFIHPELVCTTAAAHNSPVMQNFVDVTGGMFRELECLSYSKSAHSGKVESFDFITKCNPVDFSSKFETFGAELFAEFISVASNCSSRFFEFSSVLYERRRVVDKFIRNHSGHVFTCETDNGYYSVGNAFVQAKNCRCFSQTIVPGFS